MHVRHNIGDKIIPQTVAVSIAVSFLYLKLVLNILSSFSIFLQTFYFEFHLILLFCSDLVLD